MKKILFIFTFTYVFLVGCTSPDGMANEAETSKVNVVEKDSIPKHFFKKGSIKSISINQGDFYTVNEWYNDDTIIYSVGQNGVTSLYLHNLYSGEDELFFESDELLVSVSANTDYTRFAIHTVENSGKVNLTIVDQLGNIVYNWSTIAEEIQFRWNPYKTDELILTSFLPFLQFEVIGIDVTTGTINPIPVKNPFVQWINENEIGYLNWNQNEPSIDAPLFILNLDNKDERKWLDHCIMFFTHYDTVLTISVDEQQLDHSRYSFYEGQTGEKIKSIYIPILNTFSEAWWIPSYTFDRNNKLFYYMEPKRAADISDYNEGYKLKVTSLYEDQTEVLTTVEKNVQIKLSPDGNMLLLGQQFEQMIQISNKQIYNLIN